MMSTIPLERRVSASIPSTLTAIFSLALLTIVLFGPPATGTAVYTQRPRGNTARPATGTLKIQVPSGILGDNYWIYVNGRLRSSPPHGTPPRPVSVVMLLDGSGWEGWSTEGRIISSKGFDQYVKSGDKYRIFEHVEYQLQPGSYTVEILAPAVDTRPFPFVTGFTAGIQVRPGTTTEIFTAVPAGWNDFPRVSIPGEAVGYSLCRPGSPFDIAKASDRLLAWGTHYRNHSLRQALQRAAARYRPGDSVVTLDLESGTREVDAYHINAILLTFSGPPYSRGDIEYCRKLFPQYSGAFEEFVATIDGIERDKDTFRKLASDLAAARQSQ